MLRIALLVGFMAVSSSASARHIELLSFGASPNPPSVPATRGSDDLGSEMTALLTANFKGMTSTRDEAVPSDRRSRTAIVVPSWMKGGRPQRADLSDASLEGAQLAHAPSGELCGDFMYRPRPDLPPAVERRRLALYPIIARVACDVGVPAGLLDALVGQESRYRDNAISPKGAMGLTQLMPGTARQLRVSNPWHPVENLRGGARYLRMQLEEFGRVDLALAAYNAGPGNVRGRGRVPPFRETMDYVLQTTRAWQRSLLPATSERARAWPFRSRAPREAPRRVELTAYEAPISPSWSR